MLFSYFFSWLEEKQFDHVLTLSCTIVNFSQLGVFQMFYHVMCMKLLSHGIPVKGFVEFMN